MSELTSAERIHLAEVLCKGQGYTVVADDELKRLKAKHVTIGVDIAEIGKDYSAACVVVDGKVEKIVKPKPLTPEEIKAECEAEAERRGLDVEIYVDNYIVARSKRCLYPAVCYSKDRPGVPRVKKKWGDECFYDTIQDAITAFMDEVEKIVKPKSCKDVMLAAARIEIDKAKAAIAAAEHNISESISCDQ